jgi:glycosyltransferase involved in cell wall biosynthesis
VRKFVPVISLLLFQLFSFWRVVRSLGRCDAVVLDVYIMPVLFPILLIRRLAGHSPVILLRVLGNPVETGGPLRDLLYSFLYAFSIKLSATFFDKILFISPMLAQSYSAQLEIPENKIAVSPSSVDTSIFDPLPTKKTERLRRELDLSDRLGVLYHGVLTRSRGIVETVRAFKILNDESVKAKLILLGDGPAKEEILRYVQENNLGKVIQVCGPVDYCDVPDYIAACDVGIVPLPDHPWYRYQCTLKLLEYLAMKKPVIVSDIPANRSIVDDLPVAVYLHGTSPRQIADGIRAFQQSGKSLHPELGRQIAEKFSAERVAEMLEAQIRSFIN